MGQIPTIAIIGAKYFLFFVDDFSRFSWFYPLQSKDQIFSMFIKLKNLVEKQFNTSIKSLQTDNGGENLIYSNPFSPNMALSTDVLVHIYTHEQNGRVERKLQHIVETG